MAKSLKLPKRKIRNTIGMAPAPTQSEATQSVEQSGARQIRELPQDQFELVVESLRDGVTLDALTAFFSEQGWLHVTEKTFKQYLSAFRRVYPEYLRGEDDRSLNAIASKRRPKLDEEIELEQLLRVQKRRIKIGVDFEERTQIVNQTLHKDMNTATDILEKLARLRGKGGTGTVGRPSATNQALPTSASAQEQLRAADASEATQDRLAMLMGQLGNLMKSKAASNNE